MKGAAEGGWGETPNRPLHISHSSTCWSDLRPAEGHGRGKSPKSADAKKGFLYTLAS